MADHIIYNEPDLLRALAEGEEKAFNALYHHYSGAVFSFVQLYLKDELVTDDLVQVVFVRCWERRKALAGVRSLRDFLFITTRNLVYDHLRRMAVQGRRLEDLTIQAWYRPGETGTTERLDEEDLQHLHRQAIALLPEQQQEVYRRYVEQEQSFDEISETLQLARSTVKKHLEHARRSVRSYINRQLYPSLALPVLLLIGCSL